MLADDRIKVVEYVADEDIKCGRRVQLTKKGQIHHNWYYRLCIGILLKDVKKGEVAPVLTQEADFV